MRPLLAVVLLAALAPAAPVPKGLKKKADDAAALVGRWIASDEDSYSFEFKGDGWMKVWKGPVDLGATPYRWTVEGTAAAKRMTWHRSNGDLPNPEWECLYELDGDTLRITYAAAPAVPTGFGNRKTHHTTREPAK